MKVSSPSPPSIRLEPLPLTEGRLASALRPPLHRALPRTAFVRSPSALRPQPSRPADPAFVRPESAPRPYLTSSPLVVRSTYVPCCKWKHPSPARPLPLLNFLELWQIYYSSFWARIQLLDSHSVFKGKKAVPYSTTTTRSKK